MLAGTGGPDPFASIRSALAKFIEGFTEVSATAIGYHIQSMATFGWDWRKLDLWSDEQERLLRAVVQRYRDIRIQVDAAEAIVNGTSPLLAVLDQPEIDKISQALPKFQEYIRILVDFHKSVREGASAANLHVPTGDLPFEPLIQVAPSPPSGALKVVVENARWDLPASRTVLYGVESGSFSERLEKSNPSAKAALIVFEIRASYLENIDVLLNNEVFRSFSYSGKEDGADIILGPNDSLFSVEVEHTNRWSSEHLLLHVFEHYNKLILNPETPFTYEAKGLLQIRIRDRLGRAAVLPIGDITYRRTNFGFWDTQSMSLRLAVY